MQTLNRWVMGAFLGLSAITGLLVKYLADAILGLMEWSSRGMGPLATADWLGLATAFVMFVLLNRSNKVREFSAETYSELSKVAWPARQETMTSAVVIAVMVAIFSLILLGFNALWGTVVNFIY